jgi:RNase P subunit RPR2
MTNSDWRIYYRKIDPILHKAAKVYSKAQRMNIGQYVNKAIAAQLRADVAHKARPCPFCLTNMVGKKTAGIAVIHQDRKTYAVYCCEECGKERGKNDKEIPDK